MSETKLAAARVLASEIEPYLSAALWRLQFTIIPADKWPISRGEICVDEHSRGLVSSALLDRATAKQLAGALAHEVGHLVRDHGARRGLRDAIGFNVAGDAAINPDVYDAGHEMPYERHQIVMPESLPTKPRKGLSAEEYYELLEKHAIKVVIHGDCGSCAGNPHPAEGLLPPEAPEQVSAAKADMAVARLEVANAIRERVKSRGSVPGGWARWAEEELRPTKIPWQRLLAVAIRGALRRSGSQDWTYARPARRRAPGPGPILPALRAPEIRVAIVIDTSGSIGEANLSMALADVKGILKGAGAAVEVIACDAAVHSRGMVVAAGQARKHTKGGGGTDMGVGLKAAAEGRPRPEVCVVLTDGETGWPSVPPPGLRRVIIVVPEGGPPTPKWARRVERRAS